MKKILLILTLFTITFSLAQTHSCQTTGFIKHTSNFNRSVPDNGGGETDNTPYVLNTFFTLFRDNLGNTIIDSSGEIDTPEKIENKFLECVKILNKRYNSYNIYFKYTGHQVIDNTVAANYAAFDSDNFSFFDPYKQPNTLNLYFSNFNNGFALSTMGTIGGTNSIYNIGYLLAANATKLEFFLTHQMGHNLSLYKTYEIGSHLDEDDPNNGNAECERVTRDVNAPNYNADYAGDEVTDTPAQTIIPETGCTPWVYDSDDQNCYLEPYENIVKGNFMNESDNYTCAWHFTPGQIGRMRRFIANNNTNFGYLQGTDSARTDIAQLYEPFDTRVIQGDIVSIEDQPENGGAWVCRGQKYRLRFQPGFKQIFSDVTNGLITQTEDQQFNYDNSFDHGIGVEIPSINNNVIGVGVISSVTGTSCGFEPYTSGTVYSMAVLGSMNITIKELNEIETKDPELYNKLMQQYYYILKKITVSGATTEQTFYKN